VPDAHPRPQEARVELQGPLVLGDRILEAARLHQDLRQGVVRVRLVGQELDVAVVRAHGLVVTAEGGVDVAEHVPGRVQAGVERHRLLHLPDRGLVPVQPVCETELIVRPRVVGIAARHLGPEPLGLVDPAAALGHRRVDHEPLDRGDRALRGHGAREGLLEPLGVAGDVGEPEPGQREVRVLLHGGLEVLRRLRPAEPVRLDPPGLEQLSGRGIFRGDGHRATLGLGLLPLGLRRLRLLLLCARGVRAGGDHATREEKEQQQAAGSSAHRPPPERAPGVPNLGRRSREPEDPRPTGPGDFPRSEC